MKNTTNFKQNSQRQQNTRTDDYPDDEIHLPGQHPNPNKKNISQPEDKDNFDEDENQNTNKTKKDKEEVSKYIDEGNPNTQQKISQEKQPSVKKDSDSSDCGCGPE